MPLVPAQRPGVRGTGVRRSRYVDARRPRMDALRSGPDESADRGRRFLPATRSRHECRHSRPRRPCESALSGFVEAGLKRHLATVRLTLRTPLSPRVGCFSTIGDNAEPAPTAGVNRRRDGPQGTAGQGKACYLDRWSARLITAQSAGS
jgi:hypothetical protein